MIVLLTGVAGFVGYHVAERLLADGATVIGVDVVNDYYDVALKEARLARLARPGFTFHRADIAERATMAEVAAEHPDITHIVHLAAQAGVRHSMVDPYAYASSNLLGHLVVLETARHLPRLDHLVYASSSSVYGANTKLPFEEQDRVDTPLSLYAATKRADELMGHAYAHLYGVRQTGLRFFTVYGAWGRPDMAYFSFARAILRGEPITLYDGGRLRRDFTYIDDIVAGVVACLDRPPETVPPPGCSISATTRPSPSPGWSRCWSSRSAATPSSKPCRARRPTWWRPGPPWTASQPWPATRRPRRSTSASRVSWRGTRTITA